MESYDVRRDGALAGLRVVDFTWERSGPQATRILAMLGAEVIRIEWTGALDSGRRGIARTTPPGITPGPNTSGDFNNFSCNKLSCVLNARSPEGNATLKRLFAVSDVVIENFSSRVMESWGLDYEAQRAANPAIIYVSMAGFGHAGRLRDYDSWGPGNQALAGLTFMGGVPGKPPSGYGESYMDHTAGYYGAMAALVALHHRNRTGRGQYVDLSQVDVGCTLSGAALLDFTANGRPTRREGYPSGNRTTWPGHAITNGYKGRHAAPHNVYRCAGGGHWDWCVIACATEEEWQGLVAAMGRPSWAADPRFATLLGRLLEQEELDRRIGEWTLTLSKWDVVEKLQAAGVPSAPVNGTADRVDRDPQLLHRGAFATKVDHPILGERPFESLPMRMSATPWRIWRHAPLMGQDSDYVQRELCGVGEDQAGPPSPPEPVASSNGTRPAAVKTASGGALADLRVLEVTDENGEFCGKLLADLGAEVIKIEPPAGNPTRTIGPFLEDRPDPSRSLFFWHYNTSKRGITLNLDTPDGRDLFLKLAAKADIILESTMPGTMARRGLDYRRVREVNPRIIYCSVTPYGQDGPYAGYKANDLCLMASGGQLGVSGYDSADDPDETPVAPAGGNAWHTGNHYAFSAILAAVNVRDVRNIGQYIDVSIQESVAICTEGAFCDYVYAGGQRQRQTGRHASMSPPSARTQFLCKDGRYVNCLMPKLGPQQVALMAEWFGEHGLADDLADPKYQDPAEVAKAMPHILAVVERFAANVTADEMFHGGQQRKIPWCTVRAPSEIADDPHLRERGFFVEVRHPELGRSFTYPGAPYLAHGSPWRISRRAPLLGEDNEPVYISDLGLGRDRLEALKELGVV